jgi:hypothetical protein
MIGKKKLLILPAWVLVCALLLPSCAALPERSSGGETQPSSSVVFKVTLPLSTESTASHVTKAKPVAEPASPAFERPLNLTPQQVVKTYLEQVYAGYTALEYTDIASMLDRREQLCQSLVIWQKTLIQRRRLLDENGLCYVEKKQFPYTVNFIEAAELDDERVDFWSRYNNADENELTLHFVVSGEAGKAYPPQFAVNAEHTVRLKRVGGEWYITFHYFPGSRRKFISYGAKLTLPSEAEMLAALQIEFAPAKAITPSPAPAGAAVYNGALAATYASTYGEVSNPDFYNIGDWMGNCANFVSQCVWAGFRESWPNGGIMTDDWFAAGGGGSPAWENVGYFWSYATGGNELVGQELPGISAVEAGDVIQTKSHFNNRVSDPATEEEERYNHSLVVVDAEKLLLAQNSPAAFVYYSDILNVDTRLYRPEYRR